MQGCLITQIHKAGSLISSTLDLSFHKVCGEATLVIDELFHVYGENVHSTDHVEDCFHCALQELGIEL